MRLHLTPSFEVTQDTIEVTHRYNTPGGRIYHMDFKKPNSDQYYDNIILNVPLDITQPIQFSRLEHDVVEGLFECELELDEDEKNIIKELFYTFCHNHTEGTPKYAYVHSIKWQYNPYSDETLPTELNVDISNTKGDNIYATIQDSLLLQFGHKPVSFSVITYAPYEESLYGVINVYPDRTDACTTHVYKHVNGKMEHSAFDDRFCTHWLAGYEIAKYVNENLNNATTSTLESNHIHLSESQNEYIAYYIATENHSDFVSKEDFMATMHMTVTTE